MSILTQLPQVLQTVFTTVADAAGRASRLVKRADRAKFDGRSLTQTLVFGWLTHPAATLEQLSLTAHHLGVDISPQALDQRFDARTADCLQRVLAAAVTQVIAADPVALPLLNRFTGVVVQDATTITLPDLFAEQWPSCGGYAGTTPAAAMKCGVQIDLCTGTLAGPVFASGRTHDQALPWPSDLLTPGTLRITDLGFFHLDAFATLSARGVYWLSKLRVGTTLIDPAGQRWHLVPLVQTQLAHGGELPVLLGRQRVPARLLVYPVPQEVADQRRGRLRKEARDRGLTVSDATLTLAAWTILITNVPAEQLTPDEALILIRARWQIELLFKLWKSQGHLDQWRSAKPWRILCEVYAKLLAMVIQHWLLLVGCWRYPDRSLMKASRIIRHLALDLATVVDRPAESQRVLTVIQDRLQRHARINPRRTQPNTYQLLRALPDPSLYV